VATLIDASVLIAAERGGLDLGRLAEDQDGGGVAISAVTASELLHGVHRAQTAAQRQRRQAFVESLLSRLPTLPFDLEAARVHAALWADLAQAGVAIGERDLLIAATALAVDYSVTTRDQRSFPRIPGLRVELV
jgi:predicted nucleic acid-binding protein